MSMSGNKGNSYKTFGEWIAYLCTNDAKTIFSDTGSSQPMGCYIKAGHTYSFVYAQRDDCTNCPWSSGTFHDHRHRWVQCMSQSGSAAQERVCASSAGTKLVRTRLANGLNIYTHNILCTYYIRNARVATLGLPTVFVDLRHNQIIVLKLFPPNTDYFSETL